MYKYTKFYGNNPFASQSKMLYHGDRIAEYLSTGDSHPIFCEINLTNKCNLKCQWCISSNFKRDGTELEKSSLETFLLDFKNFGGKAVTFTGGGEPTQHPDFIELAEFCWFNKIDLGLMTNGVYNPRLNEYISKYCRWTRFSIDTLDEKHYIEWKGVNIHCLNIVKNNIITLKQLNTDTRIGINCNIHLDITTEEIDSLIKFSEDNDLAYVQFRPILPRYFKKEKLVLNERVWDYLRQLTNEKITLSLDKLEDLRAGTFFDFDTCEAHIWNFVLNSNGDVVVCMYHPDDDRFVFGNIYNNKLSEIWSSRQRKDVIEFLRTKLNIHNECQTCCKLCELNKLINVLNNEKTKVDVNFL